MGCELSASCCLPLCPEKKRCRLLCLLMFHSDKHFPSLLLVLRNPSAGTKWKDEILTLILLPVIQCAQQRMRKIRQLQGDGRAILFG